MKLSRVAPVFAVMSMFALGAAAQGPLEEDGVPDLGSAISPEIVCQGCMEFELEAAVGDASALEGALIFPLDRETDFRIFADLIEKRGEEEGGGFHAGEEVNFLLRRRILENGGLTLAVAPKASIFFGERRGGRAGAAFVAQYKLEENIWIGNVAATRGIGSDPSDENPRLEGDASVTYCRLLNEKGLALFGGLRYQAASEGPSEFGGEGGLLLPFGKNKLELVLEREGIEVRLIMLRM